MASDFTTLVWLPYLMLSTLAKLSLAPVHSAQTQTHTRRRLLESGGITFFKGVGGGNGGTVGTRGAPTQK